MGLEERNVLRIYNGLLEGGAQQGGVELHRKQASLEEAAHSRHEPTCPVKGRASSFSTHILW